MMTVWLEVMPAAFGFSAIVEPLIVTCALVTPDASVAKQLGRVAPEGKGVILTVLDVPFVKEAALNAI
ncbi:MAG: hypothetical protein CFE43_07005 [Burkholderiales bacterium PBB3]|nr:MAG: hypothetical protein CFE43_07005 [Burkholderiales bacterium PBB3]